MAALDETKIIDRVAEEEIFARMLQFQTARRVMIVSDGRGRGKTDLLRKLRYVCSYLQEVPVALVDLEVHRVGEEFDIAQTIRNQLAQGGVEFKGFDDLDQARSLGDKTHFMGRLQSVEGTVDLSGATVSGQAIIAGQMFKIEHTDNVSLPPWTDESERYARALCVEALFHDLHAYSQEKALVLLFDAVDRADETMRRWVLLDVLRRRFLGEAANRRIVLVLAGVGLDAMLGGLKPEQRDCLEPVATLSEWDFEHVARFLDVHGYPNLSDSDIQLIHGVIASGKPLTTALMFAQVLKSEAS